MMKMMLDSPLFDYVKENMRKDVSFNLAIASMIFFVLALIVLSIKWCSITYWSQEVEESESKSDDDVDMETL